jgi:hypothetical protein
MVTLSFAESLQSGNWSLTSASGSYTEPADPNNHYPGCTATLVQRRPGDFRPVPSASVVGGGAQAAGARRLGDGDRLAPLGRQLDDPEGLSSPDVIAYVSRIPLISPRVVYNLACVYGVAAQRVEAADPRRCTYLDIAFEYLRKSISRTPPLERKGLMPTR